ncbi:flagellar filament capping protein FliD [Sphingomonas bacterium]|uniref:flagellar filament capping protein FliD n=1 Tax=Sphingomonas bacterium TaxID=1895847 RepID=UPI001575712C|nr:flagellar filament capping protein FliD [Sphingomonas bacterium]
MTTTTSTTSTSSTAATTTVSPASIVQTLGAGSGIDITSLVSSLVTAQYAAKNSQLADQQTTLTAQISGVAAVKSGITGFESAFRSLATGGSLSTQPASSNTSVLTATGLAGSKLAGLSATLVVNQLASAQAATTNTTVDPATAFRPGTFSLQFGSDSTDSSGTTTFTAGSSSPVSITIDGSDATLSGIAAKINAANAGVTATVIADGNGQRLSIKGATGASQAFSLTGTDTDPTATGTSLSTLNVGRDATGTTIGTSAQDAIVTLDGATFHRASNTISNLISGVQLKLVAASTTPVTLGTTPPGSALSQAISNIVDTYNQVLATLQTQTDPVTGVLKADPAVTALQRSLAKLTTTPLSTASAAGAPTTLAELGVGTNKDGTLTLDQTALSNALNNFPDDVEAMLAIGSGTASTGNGLSAALSAIATAATDPTYGLDVDTANYTKQQSTVTDEQTDQTTAAAATKTQLTQQYAAMDSKISAYKSTQTFLTAQIAAWNKTS